MVPKSVANEKGELALQSCSSLVQSFTVVSDALDEILSLFPANSVLPREIAYFIAFTASDPAPVTAALIRLIVRHTHALPLLGERDFERSIGNARSRNRLKRLSQD